MAQVAPNPVPRHGYCSKCHKIWALTEPRGTCPWCGSLSYCQTGVKFRVLKPSQSRNRKQKQHPYNGNGYDNLNGNWGTYYKVASQFSHRAKVEDREDLLHDIILRLAEIEASNGHKPLSEKAMYRIASFTAMDYWRRQYQLTNGLDCRYCSQSQKQMCRENLYGKCPKAIELESLNKPIVDEDGNVTELGDLLADDNAVDLDVWLDINTWLLGCPRRLVQIGLRMAEGKRLEYKDKMYLSRWRQKELKRAQLALA